MKKYCWKNIGYSNVDVQKIGEELEILEKMTDISNRSVLDFAKRNKKSELYKCFEWDDKVASEKYRLIQATQIVSNISFVVEEEPVVKQKIYYSIKTNQEETKKFKNIKSILEDDEDYKALLDKAKKELENCKNNYENLIRKDDLKNIIFDIYKEI